jgi:hypothetical protein
MAQTGPQQAGMQKPQQQQQQQQQQQGQGQQARPQQQQPTPMDQLQAMLNNMVYRPLVLKDP